MNLSPQGMAGETLRRLRPRMQMIFQDPQACLNPRMTVGFPGFGSVLAYVRSAVASSAPGAA